ncbi:ATP-binding protein [Curvibacter cyanobacteriorum]
MPAPRLSPAPEPSESPEPPEALGTPQRRAKVAPAAQLDSVAGHKNMLQLIHLRWFAVGGQIITIAVASLVLELPLPMPQMLEVLACLIAFNIASHLRWHEQREVSNTELFVALLVDVASLTAQLYLSGGTTNPFVFLYLLQVILSAVLLEAWSTWTIVGITTACLAGLTVLSRPLALPLDHNLGPASLYVQGLLICFVLNAMLLVTFMNRIHRNLQVRDARLADLRQQAAEHEHIVRMGLLASGAAHELGTPLSTLAVILGDWRRMPEFKGNPDLLEEINDMEIQLQRCKSIVSGILLTAGETRGEDSEVTTLNGFLEALVDDWRLTRPNVPLTYTAQFPEDLPMVADSAVRQMIDNVLDNAMEASPQGLSLQARHDGEELTLEVHDQGPGFAPGMLQQFGKPYQSSKGRLGGGLGLFLVVNVARSLGGTVSARNRPEGGAVVTVKLPLSALTLDDNTVHE